MGAYIYRLKGKKHFNEVIIEGKPEKVYDLVYWYKPYYDFWSDKQPSWMKPIKMLGARLERMFKDVDVKYVRTVDVDKNGKKHYSNYVMEWRKGWTSVVDEPNWQGLKTIKLYD
jgi:hypothetical protein